MRYEIVPASPLHVGPLVRRMEGRWDKLTVFGRPRSIIRQCMAQSCESWTAVFDGVPLAMWGLDATTAGTEGYIWFCVTEPVRQYRLSMVREASAFCRRLLGTYHAIHAHVMADDIRALRFVKFLGFTVGEPTMNGAAYVVRMVR